MSDNVGVVTNWSGLVKNVGFAIGISLIYHSIAEIQCISCLLSAIFNSGSTWSRAMSAMAQSSRSWSKIGGGVAVGILFLCCLELEIWVGGKVTPPPWPY